MQHSADALRQPRYIKGDVGADPGQRQRAAARQEAISIVLDDGHAMQSRDLDQHLAARSGHDVRGGIKQRRIAS